MKNRLCAAAVLTIAMAVPASASYLHRAVKNNDLATLGALLESGEGRSVVNAAIKGGITPLHMAAVLNRVEAANMLLANGADINARTDGGFAPLHWAADRDAAEVAKVLIESGADVNAVTPARITPLHWAARKNSTRMVQLLIASGAGVSAGTANGYTPLHWAVMKDADEASMLIAYKAVSDEMEKESSQPPPAAVAEQTREPEMPAVPRQPKILPGTAFGRVLSVDLGLGESLSFVWVKSLSLWVGQYEVSNGQFRRFRPSHKSMFYEEFSLDGPDQPAVYVSWDDAMEFCLWLNTECRDRLPLGWEARLPAEAEWTAFARCGDDRTYPWGDDWPPKYGNYSDLTARRKLTEWQGIRGYDDGFVVTCPVTQSGINEWGIGGLAGNAWEWCSDWYDAEKTRKVRRGGSWDFDTRPNLRIDARGFDYPDSRYDTIGFRVVVAKK